MNKWLAKNGNTQLAALLPMNTKDTDFKSGIFLVNHVIPDGKKKQAENPINPVHINNEIELKFPKNTKSMDEVKQPNKLLHKIVSGLITVLKGIPMSLPSK